MTTQRDTNRRQRQFKQQQINEQPVNPQVIQSGGGQHISPFTIFKIIGGAGSGCYSCYEQVISASNFSANPLTNKNNIEVTVLAIAEVGQSLVLATDDYLIGYATMDDEGNKRYVGWSPKYTWWHE